MTTDDDGNVVDLAVAVDEAAVLSLRLSGLSIRRLATHFKIPQSRILTILEASLPELSQATKVRLYREDIARIDDLLMAFYPQAKQGNNAAASTCLRLLERRACMTGTDAPVRLDVVVEQTADAPNSTAQMIAMLEVIANERPAVRQIEHEPEVPPDPPAS